MTNFDPGGFLVLLTVIPAVVAGVVSVGGAHVAARLGVGDYERNVVGILALMLVAWVVAALAISEAMLHILAVVLAMVGAYAVTRDVRSASYGWVLGVVLLYVAFAVLSWAGIYAGVDRTGTPQGLIARHLFAFYYAGLFASGAFGGGLVGALLGREAETG